MNRPLNLHDESELCTIEVDHIPAHRALPNELQSSELPVAQTVPENLLLSGGILPKPASDLDDVTGVTHGFVAWYS